jgi:hypothetical protein
MSLHGVLFVPEHVGSTFLRNVYKLLPDYEASHSRRQYSLYIKDSGIKAVEAIRKKR